MPVQALYTTLKGVVRFTGQTIPLKLKRCAEPSRPFYADLHQSSTLASLLWAYTASIVNLCARCVFRNSGFFRNIILTRAIEHSDTRMWRPQKSERSMASVEKAEYSIDELERADRQSVEAVN